MDGFEGLAAAIVVAMACMLLTPSILLGAAGYFLARKKKRGFVFGLLGALLGGGLGATAIAFTFYEQAMTGTTLALEGTPSEWVVLLEDPSADNEIAWEGAIKARGTLWVPPGGVIRVRSLEHIALDGGVEVTFGERGNTMTWQRPAPEGLGATGFVVYGFFDTSGDPDVDLSTYSDEELVAWVRAHE